MSGLPDRRRPRAGVTISVSTAAPGGLSGPVSLSLVVTVTQLLLSRPAVVNAAQPRGGRAVRSCGSAFEGSGDGSCGVAGVAGSAAEPVVGAPLGTRG